MSRFDVECLDHGRRVTGHNYIRGNALRDDSTGCNHGVLANRHALQNDGVHSDPDVVADDDGHGPQFRPRRAVLEERGEGMRIDDALRGCERMKIGVGDPDIPGDQTMRADLDSFFGHDECAIQQGEIADRATSVGANGEGTAGVARNVIAHDHGAGCFAAKVPKDLRALAIKSFAEDDVGRNRLRPPIAFNPALAVYITHREG